MDPRVWGVTDARGRVAAGAGGRGAGRSTWALGARHGRWARGIGAGRAARRAAGPAGCALGVLDLFSTRFDSVLFLSQFLDIVRETGS